MSSAKGIGPHPDPVVQLEREWPATVCKLSSRWPDWQKQEQALAGFASPQLLLRFLQLPEGDPDAKDAALAALLRQTQADPLAGRLILQALLPGLKQLAGSVSRDRGGRAELWSTLLAALWERIHDYPLQRRPRRIAANLLLDTRLAVRRESERARRWSGGQAMPERLAPPRRVFPFALERPLRRAVDAGAISADEAELIAQTRIDGSPLAALAAAAGVPYDALRLRRRRAEQRFAQFLG